MKFSRRHYIAIAEVLADTNATDYTVDKMRDMFVEDNENFNSDKFREFIRDRRNKG